MPAYKDEKTKTWYVSFYYTDWTGESKRKLKRGFHKKQEALEYEREFLSQKSENCSMTFKSICELYFKDMETRLKPSTMNLKKTIVNKKILPYFKNKKLSQISPPDIRQWQNILLRENKYSQTYLKLVNSQLLCIFNYAVKYYHLKENPCQKAGSIGKLKANSMQIWTLDEYNQFIQYENKPAAKLAFNTLFWSGIRIGELLALTPKDILENKKINIDKNYFRLNKKDIILSPKTAKSIRQVAIPDFLYNEFQEYISKCYNLKENDRIFPFSSQMLSFRMKNCCKLSGVKKIRLHDLRHSHASLLIELGYNILLISERLGHENTQTTLGIYSHLYPKAHENLASGLNDLYSIKTVSKIKNDVKKP